MSHNVNSYSYWNYRFSSGDWTARGGEMQTKYFAESQVKLLGIKSNFSGSLLDFGCGLGDAIPVYRRFFPNAKLFGMDISEEAIAHCIVKFGSIAEFKQGNCYDVSNYDVVIISNVLEHLGNYEEIISNLLAKTKHLYVIVPYNENPLCLEHVNSFDEFSLREFGCYEWKVFSSKGWSQYGEKLWVDIYLKNLLRPLFCKKTVKRNMQIMFHFENDK